MPQPIKWATAITCVPERLNDLFPQTFLSFREAGWSHPLLCIDGETDGFKWTSKFELSGITMHYPRCRTFANWDLCLRELYMRNPEADRYLICQDDAIFVKNLRQYLERVPYIEKTYKNLYLFPANEKLAPKDGDKPRVGWYPSNQLGKGAVCLVFDRETVLTLAATRYMAERPASAVRGHKSVDGGIVSALKSLDVKEFVHFPSLCQHMGKTSSMGNRPQPDAPSFPGSDFDAMSLLE